MAIERLTDLGMLDDEAFARAWVESRDRARPRGERALRAELRQKGVADRAMAAALAERELAPMDAAPEAPAIGHVGDGRRGCRGRAARSPRRGGLREPDLRKRRAKAYALLARNGFDPDVAGRAVAAWLAAAGGEAHR